MGGSVTVLYLVVLRSDVEFILQGRGYDRLYVDEDKLFGWVIPGIEVATVDGPPDNVPLRRWVGET